MAYDLNTDSLILKWEKDARRVRDEVTRFNHRLAETGLFEDDALAKLLDSHPYDELTICTMRPNPPAFERWIAGEARGLDGGQLLEAVKQGRFWISPRHVMTTNTVYADLFRRLMAEYREATGLTIASSDGALILSSPTMGVFYHVDLAETMLWHIRGHKTIHLYPPHEPFVSEASLEAILLKENLTDLPYSPDLEAGVMRVDLGPGDAVSWPVHSPHRVCNGEDLNVSISIEYTTPKTVMLNGVYYFNGRVRRMTGVNLSAKHTPAMLKPAWAIGAKALKVLAPRKVTAETTHERRFDIDFSARHCIAWRGQAPDWAA
jgi:hypothetical protein